MKKIQKTYKTNKHNKTQRKIFEINLHIQVVIKKGTRNKSGR